MKRITNINLPADLLDHFGKQDPWVIKKQDPFPVDSFSNLVKHSAQVACRNPTYTILYRGQCNEHRNNDGTILLPSLYRWEKKSSKEPPAELIRTRLNTLNKMSEELFKVATQRVEMGILTKDEVNYSQLEKRPSLRWGVLQHYGYCPTPYLDVTQSLRIACMFALDGAKQTDRPCVYMLGLPYMNDKYFRESDSELMVVRLLSAMPPIAKRAYFQEGYLIGSEFDRYSYAKENDAAQRLIAKFELIGDKENWIRQLSTFARSDVYSEDPFSRMRDEVSQRANHAVPTTNDSIEYANPDRFPSLTKEDS